MTTIMGMKGYDPLRKKDYVLFASDSKWNLGHENTKYNARKIFTNYEGNLMIAYGGAAILQEETADKQAGHIKKAAQRFFGKGHNSAKETIHELKKLDKITNYNDHANAYIFSNKNDLSLIWYMDGEAYAVDTMTLLGTGAEKLRKRNLIASGLKKFDYADEKGIYSELTGLLKTAFDLAEKASEIDISTGGFFNFGILTNESAMIFEEFTPMHNSHPPDELFDIGKKCLMNKLLGQGVSIKSVDDLVLV